MKRFFFFFLSFVAVFSLALPAFAAEGEGGDTSGSVTPSGDVYNQTYNMEDGDTFYVTFDNTEEIVDTSEGAMVGYNTYPDSSSHTYSVTAADANGLKAVMLSLIGDYEGIVVEYAYENSNGYTSYVREIQLDYPWLCSCAIFLVVLFCILRGGFAVLCKR